jgi:hypothetical protein
MFSAKIVEGLETIAKKFATQGHASFTQHGRVPENPNTGPLSRLSDADYEASPLPSAPTRYRAGGLERGPLRWISDTRTVKLDDELREALRKVGS